MKNTDTLDIQIDLAFTKAKELIDNLKDRQALYIINKNMEARVLFYYKKDALFLSDSFKLDADYIQFNDSNQVEEICEQITNKFENSDSLKSSILVKDINSIILKYFIDSLIFKIHDRIKYNIPEVKSLEIYNDFIVVNMNGIFKVFRQDNKFVYDKIRINKVDFKKYTLLEDLLKTEYSKFGIFPHNYDYLKDIYNEGFDTFDPKNIVSEDDFPTILTIAVVSSEELITIGLTVIPYDEQYTDEDLSDITNDMIDIVKNSENIESDLDILMDNLYPDDDQNHDMLS